MNFFRLLTTGLLCVALLCICSFAEAQENQQQPNQTIRVQVDRVNVGVIVTDHSGHFVEGLRREDFHLYDNGMEQPLTGFAAIEEPAQVLLLIEAGPAVHLLGSNHVRASDTLLKNLSPNDRVAIASYSKDPELLLDFTPDKPTAEFALQSLNFTLGFAELNLSSSLASAIDWLAPFPGKKTIVVLSTGVDTSPAEKRKSCKRLSKNSRLPMCASWQCHSPATSESFPNGGNSRLRSAKIARSSSKVLRRPIKRCRNSRWQRAGAYISRRMRRNSIARIPRSRNWSATNTASRSVRPSKTAKCTRFK